MGGGGATTKVETKQARKERPGSACFAAARPRMFTRDKIATAAVLLGLKDEDGGAGIRAAGGRQKYC